MKKTVLVVTVIIGVCLQLTAQTEHKKTLVSMGGEVHPAGNMAHVSAIGEFAVSSFNTGYYSGNIGYLNNDDFASGVREEQNLNSVISVFPNPSNESIVISGLTEKANATIMDARGRIVLASEIFNNKVDVSLLAAGVYVLRIETAKGLGNFRIIKQ